MIKNAFVAEYLLLIADDVRLHSEPFPPLTISPDGNLGQRHPLHSRHKPPFTVDEVDSRTRQYSVSTATPMKMHPSKDKATAISKLIRRKSGNISESGTLGHFPVFAALSSLGGIVLNFLFFLSLSPISQTAPLYVGPSLYLATFKCSPSPNRTLYIALSALMNDEWVAVF